ncbi:ATP-binding protein [Aliidiomarina sanyensis]|uniref:histidine kinase n=1 Tax=Aliidiomarina sanyensis TaxID=1249555 RepID=A0A432WIE8_9GAMM|nr:ATP-binding protein [Aliidiomarina sanyensis]RUO33543.1 hypothetical protein CWE11_06800 [Aliidiomarina sanyensis]
MATLKQSETPSNTQQKRRFERWSLVQRLNVIVSGIVAFALLIFIAMTALWVSNSERNQLAQQTTTLAQQIASQAAGIEMGESQLQMMLSGLSPYESILHAHIYTISPDGETLTYLIGYHQQGRSPLPSQENQIDGSVQHVFTSDYIQVTVPIYQDRNLTGVVMLRSSLHGVKSQFQRHLSFSLGIFLVVMLSVTVGLRFFTRSLETSIHRFTRAIADASQTKERTLDNTPYLPSEFSELRHQVRRLLEKYRQEQRYAEHASAQARNATERLDSEVSERTHALLEANRRLTQALEELHQYQRKRLTEDKLASLGDVIAGISHELNTPIGAAITAATLLEDKQRELEDGLLEHEPESPEHSSLLDSFFEQGRESLRIINKNLDRCAELVRHFQQMAMFNRNDTPHEVNLRACAERTIERVENALVVPEHVRIVLECSEDQTVQLRPLVMEQLLTELIENVIRHATIYTDDGEPLPLTTTIRIWMEHGQILVEVADDGRGIAPEILARMFEPFVTSGRSQGDKGLGLYRVFNWLTHLLHGDVQCESDVFVKNEDRPHGTRVTLYIPMEPSA